MSSGSSSHFMCADTVVQYMEEVLSDAFARRRRVLAERYGVSYEDE